MNDVIQRAKNKHMDVLIPAFQPAVLSAVSMGRYVRFFFTEILRWNSVLVITVLIKEFSECEASDEPLH